MDSGMCTRSMCNMYLPSLTLMVRVAKESQKKGKFIQGKFQRSFQILLEIGLGALTSKYVTCYTELGNSSQPSID